MFNGIKKYNQFYSSILLGVFIWLLSFLILPAKAVEILKLETLLFIFACYAALIIGFKTVNVKTKITDYNEINEKKLIRFLSLIIIISFFLRWLDLFYFRNLSFSYDFKENRRLNVAAISANIIFIFASIFKSIYFFPFVIQLRRKSKAKMTLFVTSLLLSFPFVEALLFGTRKPFFDVVLIIFISLIIFTKIKFNAINSIILVVTTFLLITISSSILLKRESSKNTQEDVYKVITKARYNDLLQPNNKVIDYINDPSVDVYKKKYALILMQTGQYINHGVFEFNHIIQTKLPVGYGKYTMYPFFKFFKNIVEKKNFENFNPSPREYVYLTAFGSFYLDFRWFTILIFFILGAFQKYVYVKSQNKILYTPLLIYLSIINVFLPIMNYIRGSGLYPFVAFGLLLVIYNFYSIISNEKSTGT